MSHPLQYEMIMGTPEDLQAAIQQMQLGAEREQFVHNLICEVFDLMREHNLSHSAAVDYARARHDAISAELDRQGQPGSEDEVALLNQMLEEAAERTRGIIDRAQVLVSLDQIGRSEAPPVDLAEVRRTVTEELAELEADQ